MLFGRNKLSRRTVLRGAMLGGATVALPLPRLGAMLNGNGTAYADGTALPARFGWWFFGNGIIPERWVPPRTGVGNNWVLSEELAPLENVKPWVQVVSGTAIKVPDRAPHSSFTAAALSGADSAPGTTLLPTIEQVIGKLINSGTTFPSGLHVGIGNSGGGTEIGDTHSFSGMHMPNPAEFDPANMFKKLMPFASSATGKPTAPDPELLRRQMVLDVVSNQANNLRKRLGMDDQQRLDRHLQGVQELQTQIMRASGPKVSGKLVDPATAHPNAGGVGSLTRERCQAFHDLLVFAMSTDLTRIFSFTFTPAASFQVYSDCGLPGGYHSTYGHRGSPMGAAFATVGMNTGVRYAIGNMGDLLTRMKETPDGAGNLLDNSCVYTTSCTSEAQTHSPLDFPVIVAGKAGGKLKGDQHIRLIDENTSKVLYTMYTAYGGTDPTFGKDLGQVSSGIPEMLA